MPSNQTTARPLAEWREEDGDVLWWFFPMTEAPYIGSPLALGRIVEIRAQEGVIASGTVGGWPGYHTHWTPLPPIPQEPPTQKPTAEELTVFLSEFSFRPVRLGSAAEIKSIASKVHSWLTDMAGESSDA